MLLFIPNIFLFTEIKGNWKQNPEANVGPQMDQNEEWIMLHNEETHGLYRSVSVIKSRTLRWSRNVGRMENIGVKLELIIRDRK